jgi:hypothetical protein
MPAPTTIAVVDLFTCSSFLVSRILPGRRVSPGVVLYSATPGPETHLSQSGERLRCSPLWPTVMPAERIE